jgi:hypothetical protein
MPDVPVTSSVEIVNVPDERKQEADLERHLDNESANTAESSGETVEAEEDYPLYEALNLLRAAHVLSAAN